MKCKHPLSDRFMRFDDVLAVPDNLKMVREYCGRCGSWLSLGPSDEHASEQVEIEIRAAEIAFNDGPIRKCDNSMPVDCEECGWDCWPFASAMHDASPAQWAGYLARCITEHEEEL